MSLVTETAHHPAIAGVMHASSFAVEFTSDWTSGAADWEGAYRRGSATVFQHGLWLGAWYGAFAGKQGVEPVLATIKDASTNEIALRLPLIRRWVKGVRVVEFADLELTDYNAPLLGPAAPREPSAAAAMWRDLRRALRALPGGVDLVRWRKMPLSIDGEPNPLAMLRATRPCSLNGNLVTTGDDFEDYRRSLKRDVRKVLARCWRTFTRDPAAAFRIAADQADALRVLSALEDQQGARMRHLGKHYMLNDEGPSAFYRSLVRSGVDDGYTILSTLAVGNEFVATLLGVRSGDRYVMIRIGTAGEKWSSCSPGRLIIERTMAALHRDGVRQFDFSVGNYAYKRRLGVVATPLVDLTAALSWRGLPYVLRDHTAQWLRRHPVLRERAMRCFGKKPTREED